MITSNSNAHCHLMAFFEQSVDKYPNHTALISEDTILLYRELELKTNQLAHYLIDKGVGEAHAVGIFLERSQACYIAILAVLKTGAAYVPIDTEYPDERVNYILNDMPFKAVITSSLQAARASSIQFPETIILNTLEEKLLTYPEHRPTRNAPKASQLCYVIYTSGSTGKPKGVEITHESICHYVREASKLYAMKPTDRVYQGFSLAFDASLEELWMAFANGAALVACASKDTRSGVGLVDFLHANEVTVLSTVPTLAATLEPTLPHLRLLILGGEACTSNLVQSWSRDNLTIMNTYGPTEATVIATACVCQPDRPISIGKPLPGYEVIIVDEELKPVPDGQRGQLCIAGVALARGYVNRPEMTHEKFVPHPFKKNQRLYLTGDLVVRNSAGEIEFLGRIDSQIKLRGFRIELNEIENVMIEYPGVKQAVVALHDLSIPTLVAYVLSEKKNPVDLGKFKAFLQKQLPHYMVPGHIELVKEFPLLTSGKVNRNALPKPVLLVSETDYVAPSNDLERAVTAIFETALQQSPISVEADFFYDLGGHSLFAAKIISELRKVTHSENVSILDLYQNPTIRQLTDKISRIKVTTPPEERRPKKSRVTQLTYTLCAIGQFFGCLFQYAVQSWQLLAIVLCYSWLETHGDGYSFTSLGLSFLLLFFGIPICSLLICICSKWILLGRVKPGKYKLWGSFYWRWWLVERLHKNVFSPNHFTGSPLINLYYRLLGAKIGRNCYIGTSYIIAYDMLTMGDNCSLGFDASLRGFVVEDGWLKIGPITLGNHCFLGSRSVVGIHTSMQDNSALDDMSMLPANSIVPKGQFFSGSPARQSIMPADHMMQSASIDTSSRLKTFTFGVLHYLCLISAMLVFYGCYYPALVLISHVHEETHYLLTLFIAAPVGAISFLSLYYLSVGICKKILLNRIKPGIYPLKSFYYLRQWMLVKMLDVNEIAILADSLYFPTILRFLGAKIGKRVEMGETPHIIPDLVTIQDEGFTASSVGLAWPSIHQGLIKFAPIQIGKRSFVGNVSLLPLGANMGDEGLLGCMTIIPPNNLAAKNQTAWLGSPAMLLPKREEFEGYSEDERFNPSKKLFYTRLLIEFCRIILPTTFILVEIFGLLYALNALLSNYTLYTTILAFPLAEAGINIALVGVFIGLKWLILGKLKPTTRPLWNILIWKNDVISYMHSYFVDVFFTNVVLGTPFASFLFRCLGSKIGKRVFIDTPDFAEFDLIHIGDESCINAGTIVQTHLYEDRVFKISNVNIQSGCNVGSASIVLYNAVMEKNSTLGSLSLLMKGETLPYGTSWQGIPAQSMNTHYVDNVQQNVSTNPAPSSDTVVLEAG